MNNDYEYVFMREMFNISKRQEQVEDWSEEKQRILQKEILDLLEHKFSLKDVAETYLNLGSDFNKLVHQLLDKTSEFENSPAKIEKYLADFRAYHILIGSTPSDAVLQKDLEGDLSVMKYLDDYKKGLETNSESDIKKNSTYYHRLVA